MKYIFGPVFSRRLGLSLGVDLVPYKVCSMDCLYCEVGATTEKTLKRAEYVPIEGVKSELEEYLSFKPEIDFITFSGYGEPTLYSRLGELVSYLKSEHPEYQLALLTNASLLHRDNVLEEILPIDVVLPSLDAGREETFKKLNRPAEGLSLKNILEGIEKLMERKKGKVWIETLFVKGINDSEEEVEKIGEIIKRLNPDRWQLNTVVRPPAFGVEGLSFEELNRIKEQVEFPRTEIIAHKKGKEVNLPFKELKEEILSLVSRRPCPVEEIADALGISTDEVMKAVEELKSEGKVQEVLFGGEPYVKGICG